MPFAYRVVLPGLDAANATDIWRAALLSICFVQMRALAGLAGEERGVLVRGPNHLQSNGLLFDWHAFQTDAERRRVYQLFFVGHSPSTRVTALYWPEWPVEP